MGDGFVNMDNLTNRAHITAREKFLELSLKSTRKSYYPQLQKQLESAQANEKSLQLLIDNLPAQISYVNSEERYVLVNSEFENVFGRNRAQIIGKRMERVLGQKNYEKIRPDIISALSGKSGRSEFSVATHKKHVRFYEIHYVPEKDGKGNVNGFYLLVVDLTEQKKGEKERLELKDRLRQAQKMEAIGTLSGGIAHDFNNILSGVFGYSQLIENHLNEPDRVSEYNQKIIEGAKRASSLIKQILSFSRQSKHNKQPLNFHLILREVLKLIRSTLPSNIEINEKIHSRAKVLADSTQMHQVIMNLCTNAYHALGTDGGTLTIMLDEKNLPDSNKDIKGSGGTYLRLSVMDNGPGIEDHIKEKIFDPYFTTKEIGRGTGLGLAVVAGIIKKHNGYINFDTKLGAGTTFHIYLPVISDEPSKIDKPEKIEEASAVSGRIMIVDDEKAILETMDAILSREGYQVVTYENPVSALKVFGKSPDQFDLIITDMTMPKMTGDKLSSEILKIRHNMPIVICSGYHERISEADADKLGVKKIIQKPVLGSDLQRIIQKLLLED